MSKFFTFSLSFCIFLGLSLQIFWASVALMSRESLTEHDKADIENLKDDLIESLPPVFYSVPSSPTRSRGRTLISVHITHRYRMHNNT